MRIGIQAYYILVGSLTAIALTSCGGEKGKSQGATLGINPQKPIVITADATLQGDKKVAGPWFQFSMSMTNGTAEKITIVALTADVYTQNSSGQSEKKTVAFTPGEFDYKIGSSTECKFTSFGTWAAGETKGLLLDNGNADCNARPIFVVSGLNTGPNGTNFRYRVTAKPLGWFGTIDAATDRFDRSVTFFTQ